LILVTQNASVNTLETAAPRARAIAPSTIVKLRSAGSKAEAAVVTVVADPFGLTLKPAR